MKKLIILTLALVSTLSIASTEPTMRCTLGQKKEIKVYGPLGYFYEDDLRHNSEVSFPNTVELIVNGKVVNTLPNSTSMVNDSNEYTITSYILGTRDLTLRKVLNLYFASEEGSVAHTNIAVENFRYRGRAHCRLIH
ncbi:MAG TPA: hypothetical protein VKY27_05470 [Bacteriovoracaceae bacterium]|nr:hypothetical protein [Bacteriovoracaceae bacterium]